MMFITEAAIMAQESNDIDYIINKLNEYKEKVEVYLLYNLYHLILVPL